MIYFDYGKYELLENNFFRGVDFMKFSHNESKLVEEAVKLRQELTHSLFDIDGIMRIYLKTSVSDYFYFESPEKNKKRKLRKHNFFV